MSCIEVRAQAEMVDGYPVVRDDGGRFASYYPREINDCTVRSLAILTCQPYGVVYRLLRDHGRKKNDGFYHNLMLDRFLKHGTPFFGYSVTRVTCPLIKGQKRMTVAEFVRRHPKGRWALGDDEHVCAMIDGVVYDIAHSKWRKHVNKAYCFTPVNTERKA